MCFFKPLCAYTALLLLISPTVWAQHAGDLRFHYLNNQITLIPNSGQVGNVWTSEFEVGGFFAQETESPGFTSESIEGYGIQPGNTIAYDVLDNLIFWDGSQFSDAGSGVGIKITNGLGAATTVTDNSGEQLGSANSPYSNGLGNAFANGDYHVHRNFALEPNPGSPPQGAYGLKLRLLTSAIGIAPSEPFLIVFNFGLAEQAFEDALPGFDALLAEGQPGDFNDDGYVDGRDYAIWREGLNSTYTTQQFNEWKNHYGVTPSATAAPLQPTPEPGTGFLFVTFMLLGSASTARHVRPTLLAV